MPPLHLFPCSSPFNPLLTVRLPHGLASFSHPAQLKDQVGPGGPQQALSPAQLPEEAECLTVPKYKRDLVQKLKILRQELSQHQPQAGHCRIEVSREEIFEVRIKAAQLHDTIIFTQRNAHERVARSFS